jgi:structural maintenance of chromosome 1
LRSDITNIDKDLKKMAPERKAKQAAVKNIEDQLAGLEQILNDADDEVFAEFCESIEVDSIRDYEDVQLRMAREEDAALEKFTTQKARIGHQ